MEKVDAQAQQPLGLRFNGWVIFQIKQAQEEVFKNIFDYKQSQNVPGDTLTSMKLDEKNSSLVEFM